MKISIKPAKIGIHIDTEKVYPELEDIEITPTTEEQKIKSENYYGYNEVTVKPVTADIDSNIIPENIKKGTSILGVEGECKGEVETNVFMQETEPEKKDGIWLQGNYVVENIVADANVFTSKEWNTSKALRLAPYLLTGCSATIIGTDIYIFGGSNGQNNAYKYNTLTDTYTKLANIPYAFYFGSASAVGTDIYLFGGSTDSYLYKYDTLTNSYEQLSNTYNFNGGCSVVIGTDIYLFGSSYSESVGKRAYRYDTVSKTHYRLSDIPTSLDKGSCAVVGTDIYLFGGKDYKQLAYRYNTLNDTYTKLTNIPYTFYDSCTVSVGTDIYLFWSDTTDYERYCYKYDTKKNTYTSLGLIPENYIKGCAVFNGIDIFLFCGASSSSMKVQVMTMIPKEFPNKSIVIAQDGSIRHSTNLADVGILNLKTIYDRVYYRDNNGKLLNNIPIYNGDGTTWARI